MHAAYGQQRLAPRNVLAPNLQNRHSSLRSERVEFIVHTFPDLYEIIKKGKGRYVVLKDRLSDAKQALGIETDDDDDLF